MTIEEEKAKIAAEKAEAEAKAKAEEEVFLCINGFGLLFSSAVFLFLWQSRCPLFLCSIYNLMVIR